MGLKYTTYRCTDPYLIALLITLHLSCLEPVSCVTNSLSSGYVKESAVIILQIVNKYSVQIESNENI